MNGKFKVPERMDLTKSKTFTARNRTNLVTIDNLEQPENAFRKTWTSPDFEELAQRILLARREGKAVIWFMGAHVIKCGLSRYIIRLMEEGILTHIAGNGATSIHDFELAYLGGTSEHVPTAIEDGSFGMWEETGLWMNTAIREGFAQGWGYGQCLAEYIAAHPAQFPYKQDCVLYRAYEMGIPATYHVSMGTDIINQHPAADFAALGGASGLDFAAFTKSVSGLAGGVFLNVGSAIAGAEVFLKALAIARNQTGEPKVFSTGNFDIIPLGDYRSDVSKDHFHYYYRPRKNVINRPSSLGGKGFYIEANHMDTIPALYRAVMNAKGGS